jgi:hypothetical protein
MRRRLGPTHMGGHVSPASLPESVERTLREKVAQHPPPAITLIVSSSSIPGEDVPRPRVVVLTAHSLFTEGIATRLRQHLDQIDLKVVDSRGPRCLASIRQARPAVILLEASDEITSGFCTLERLLEVAPEAKVVRLDRDLDRIQVITGELKAVQGPSDLIHLLVPKPPDRASGRERERTAPEWVEGGCV